MFSDKSILRAHQISTAIIDLVDESKGHCYLVSPWIRLWQQLERSLEKAAGRGLRLTIVLRDDEKSRNTEAARQFNERFGAEVVLLPNLHTKVSLGDRRAIIGSMNLYDVSQTRNFELAYELRGHHELETIKRDVIEGDLLAVKPKLRLAGKFESVRAAESARLAELDAELASAGFCVVCNYKMDLDRQPEPGYVRCRTCYYKAPDADFTRLRTSYCHLCGKPFDSVLGRPLHAECRAKLVEFVTLKK